MKLGEKYGVDLKTHRKYETPSDSSIMEMADGEDIDLEAGEKCRALIGVHSCTFPLRAGLTLHMQCTG